MASKKKMVIWDWNGTVIDDTELCYEIANHMRVERDMEPLDGVDKYRDIFMFPVREYYKRMGYTFETESYEDIAVEFTDMYLARFPECSLRSGVLDVLAEVRRRSLTQVLLSATGQERLDVQVTRFPLFGLFDRVLGTRDNLANGKVDVALAFLRETGVPPGDVLFVGDTDHDFEVAQAIGCDALLLTSGHQSVPTLSRCCVPVLDDVRDVLKYL